MKLRVTDHALVRWLERVGGIDMEYFREHIASLVRDAADAGAASITIDGFTYTIATKTKTVTTVLENDMRPRKLKNAKTLPDYRYGDREGDELSYMQAAE